MKKKKILSLMLVMAAVAQLSVPNVAHAVEPVTYVDNIPSDVEACPHFPAEPANTIFDPETGEEHTYYTIIPHDYVPANECTYQPEHGMGLINSNSGKFKLQPNGYTYVREQTIDPDWSQYKRCNNCGKYEGGVIPMSQIVRTQVEVAGVDFINDGYTYSSMIFSPVNDIKALEQNNVFEISLFDSNKDYIINKVLSNYGITRSEDKDYILTAKDKHNYNLEIVSKSSKTDEPSTDVPKTDEPSTKPATKPIIKPVVNTPVAAPTSAPASTSAPVAPVATPVKAEIKANIIDAVADINSVRNNRNLAEVVADKDNTTIPVELFKNAAGQNLNGVHVHNGDIALTFLSNNKLKSQKAVDISNAVAYDKNFMVIAFNNTDKLSATTILHAVAPEGAKKAVVYRLNAELQKVKIGETTVTDQGRFCFPITRLGAFEVDFEF